MIRINPENILAAFLYFSAIGWTLELTYRSYKAKRIGNPGFLKGPYTPIYGFGGLFAYFSFLYSEELSIFGALAVFAVSVILLEYFTGLFFEKAFKIRLWDYSDRRFNIQGHICPTFIFYWFVLGVFFQAFLFPHFDRLIRARTFSGLSIFFLGLFYGFFLIDLIQTFDLAYKMKATVNDFGQDHLSPRILTLRNVYGEASRKLNEKVRLDEKKSFSKEVIFFVLNYFRITRSIGDELKKVIKNRSEEG